MTGGWRGAPGPGARAGGDGEAYSARNARIHDHHRAHFAVAGDLRGDAESIATALGGSRGQRPVRNRRGWLARCPSHEDRHASLSLANTPDGKLLAYCFAGCSWAEIREALIRRGFLAENDNQPRRRPPPFWVSIGDKLMLANIVEDDHVLSAAWQTGDVELFVSRFVALRRGCDGPDMKARTSILELGPDLQAFTRSLFGVGR